ncbi:LysR substrate-binding domain-containing protein [Ureibacillus sp. NPDC094379]
MELRNLKTFQVVAQELNITRAAKRLGYTQPTITLQIQSLEKELNHTLLARVGKKTLLTAAGKKLKFHVDNLFTLIDEIEKDMEELHGPSGILTIAASEHYCTQHLSQLAKTYMEIYPDVKIRLLPLNSVHAIQSVRDHVADIAVIGNECDDLDLSKTFLEEEQTFLVVSSEIGKERSLQDILREDAFISCDHHCSVSDIIDQFFKKIDFHPQSTIMIGGSDNMIKRAVLNCTGYAILGENSVKNEIKDGSITVLHQGSESIITSAVNLKVRSEEPNIQTFNGFLQNAWSVSNNFSERSLAYDY